jgi:hypothetical protein
MFSPRRRTLPAHRPLRQELSRPIVYGARFIAEYAAMLSGHLTEVNPAGIRREWCYQPVSGTDVQTLQIAQNE